MWKASPLYMKRIAGRTGGDQHWQHMLGWGPRTPPVRCYAHHLSKLWTLMARLDLSVSRTLVEELV